MDRYLNGGSRPAWLKNIDPLPSWRSETPPPMQPATKRGQSSKADEETTAKQTPTGSKHSRPDATQPHGPPERKRKATSDPTDRLVSEVEVLNAITQQSRHNTHTARMMDLVMTNRASPAVRAEYEQLAELFRQRLRCDKHARPNAPTTVPAAKADVSALLEAGPSPGHAPGNVVDAASSTLGSSKNNPVTIDDDSDAEPEPPKEISPTSTEARSFHKTLSTGMVHSGQHSAEVGLQNGNLLGQHAGDVSDSPGSNSTKTSAPDSPAVPRMLASGSRVNQRLSHRRPPTTGLRGIGSQVHPPAQVRRPTVVTLGVSQPALTQAQRDVLPADLSPSALELIAEWVQEESLCARLLRQSRTGFMTTEDAQRLTILLNHARLVGSEIDKPISRRSAAATPAMLTQPANTVKSPVLGLRHQLSATMHPTAPRTSHSRLVEQQHSGSVSRSGGDAGESRAVGPILGVPPAKARRGPTNGWTDRLAAIGGASTPESRTAYDSVAHCEPRWPSGSDAYDDMRVSTALSELRKDTPLGPCNTSPSVEAAQTTQARTAPPALRLPAATVLPEDDFDGLFEFMDEHLPNGLNLLSGAEDDPVVAEPAVPTKDSTSAPY